MIKANDGRKVSPREKARELLINQALDFRTFDAEAEAMTDRELNLVVDSLEREFNWLADKWGWSEITLDHLRRR